MSIRGVPARQRLRQDENLGAKDSALDRFDGERVVTFKLFESCRSDFRRCDPASTRDCDLPIVTRREND